MKTYIHELTEKIYNQFKTIDLEKTRFYYVLLR